MESNENNFQTCNSSQYEIQYSIKKPDHSLDQYGQLSSQKKCERKSVSQYNYREQQQLQECTQKKEDQILEKLGKKAISIQEDSGEQSDISQRLNFFRHQMISEKKVQKQNNQQHQQQQKKVDQNNLNQIFQNPENNFGAGGISDTSSIVHQINLSQINVLKQRNSEGKGLNQNSLDFTQESGVYANNFFVNEDWREVEKEIFGECESKNNIQLQTENKNSQQCFLKEMGGLPFQRENVVAGEQEGGRNQRVENNNVNYNQINTNKIKSSLIFDEQNYRQNSQVYEESEFVLIRGSELKKLMRKQETFEEILVQQQIKIKQLEREKMEALEIQSEQQQKLVQWEQKNSMQQKIRFLAPANPVQIIQKQFGFQNKENVNASQILKTDRSSYDFHQQKGLQNNQVCQNQEQKQIIQKEQQSISPQKNQKCFQQNQSQTLIQQLNVQPSRGNFSLMGKAAQLEINKQRGLIKQNSQKDLAQQEKKVEVELFEENAKNPSSNYSQNQNLNQNQISQNPNFSQIQNYQNQNFSQNQNFQQNQNFSQNQNFQQNPLEETISNVDENQDYALNQNNINQREIQPNKQSFVGERAPLKLISDLNLKKPPLASHRNFAKSKIFNSSSSTSLLSNQQAQTVYTEPCEQMITNESENGINATNQNENFLNNDKFNQNYEYIFSERNNPSQQQKNTQPQIQSARNHTLQNNNLNNKETQNFPKRHFSPGIEKIQTQHFQTLNTRQRSYASLNHQDQLKTEETPQNHYNSLGKNHRNIASKSINFQEFNKRENEITSIKEINKINLKREIENNGENCNIY